MEGLTEFLKGKKTYIVGALIVIGAALEMAGISIPLWVFVILGGLGLTTIRSGIDNLKKDSGALLLLVCLAAAALALYGLGVSWEAVLTDRTIWLAAA